MNTVLGKQFFVANVLPLLHETIAACEARFAQTHPNIDLADVIPMIQVEFIAQKYTLAKLLPPDFVPSTLSHPDRVNACAAEAAIADLQTLIERALHDEIRDQTRPRRHRR